jgi:hypothetical protein
VIHITLLFRDLFRYFYDFSYLAIISIDGAITRAKIVHKNWGRYVIVEDSKGGKYVNKVIDAGDIMQVEK